MQFKQKVDAYKARKEEIKTLRTQLRDLERAHLEQTKKDLGFDDNGGVSIEQVVEIVQKLSESPAQ